MIPNEYQDLERQLKSQTAKQQEAAKRKLEQQFSAAGRLRSGSAAKLITQAQQEIGSQGEQQVAALRKEASDKAREERLMGEQRSFQTSEREASQQFATGERTGTQEFQAGQAALDRALQERGINLGFDQLREQQRQFNAEFDENIRTNLFNKIVSLRDFAPDEFARAAEYLGYGAREAGSIVGTSGRLAPATTTGGTQQGPGQTPQLPTPSGSQPNIGFGPGGPAAAPRATTPRQTAQGPRTADVVSGLVGVPEGRKSQFLTSLKALQQAGSNPNNQNSRAAQSNAEAIEAIVKSSKVRDSEKIVLLEQLRQSNANDSRSLGNLSLQVSKLKKKYKI